MSVQVVCQPNIEATWFAQIGKEFSLPYMQELKNFLTSRVKNIGN